MDQEIMDLDSVPSCAIYFSCDLGQVTSYLAVWRLKMTNFSGELKGLINVD